MTFTTAGLDRPPGNLRDWLTHCALARSTTERLEITPREHERMLELAHQWPRVYAGSYHLTIPSERRKYVVFNEYPVPNGELAREYVKQCWEASCWGGVPPDKSPRKARHPYWNRRAPLYCRPVRHRSLAYVDIHHAYWSIVEPYCLDHVLSTSGNTVAGVVPFLYPREVDRDRRLRHAVVGTLFSHQLSWLAWGEWKTVPLASPTSNPSLARITFDTMHAVCRDVREHFETFAWLTDACIVARKDGPAVVEMLRERWALSSRVVAEGMGAVWAPSTYRVGPKVTLDISNRNASYTVTECEKINPRISVRRWREERRRAVLG